MSEVETRYSQIEREALAIAWACRHFRMYVLGKQFAIVTNHKPLLAIFNNARSEASTRIENWRLRLQCFDFVVYYEKRKDNPADYVSRCVDAHDIYNIDDFVSHSGDRQAVYTLNSSMPVALSIDDVAKATSTDNVLQTVKQAIFATN